MHRCRHEARIAILAGAITLLPSVPGLCAQKDAESGYPSRPMRMIVTSQAGSAPDVLARILGQRLGEAFGQQVVVDNRAGAGGVIGYEIASRALPDGYTTVM